MTDTSRELLASYRSGSDDAATLIFHRYVGRLTALARLRLSEKIARRIDPEDVVLSAYRSFFVAARNGRFHLENGGDLWRLLVSITIHKLHRQVAAHCTIKRSTSNEVDVDSLDFVPSRDPTPEEVLAASDELETILSNLPPLARQVVELRMQGESLTSIATEIDRTERTVRRMLEVVRNAFQQRLGIYFDLATANVEPPLAECLEPITTRAMTPPTTHPHQQPQEVRSIGFAETTVELDTLASDDFLIERHIGSGGSGKVYRAIDRRSGRQVAVKFLRKSFQSEPQAVKRFFNEASIIQRLRHPGIVSMHGVGRTLQGALFLVMDWFPDGDLDLQIKRGTIRVADAIRYVRDAATTIQYSHDNGILHCDLKPSNLLLNESGHAIITDFGLARSTLTPKEFSLEGTAGYMALEQAVPGFGKIGPWTDIYGLGAVLYSLLTGHPPYTAKRPSEILSKLIANVEIPIPSHHRPEIPASLDDLCFQCLNRDIGSRPQSGNQVAGRLCEISEQLARITGSDL